MYMQEQSVANVDFEVLCYIFIIDINLKVS